jgi:sugar/nucleoside kinase (ribokinase family)
VAGHTNLDHLLDVRNLPTLDRTVPVLRRELRLGGTAANIARAAAGWGVRVGLMSRVGNDFPPEFRALLEQEHVDLRGVETVTSVPSSACFIAEDGRGGQSTMIDQGPMRTDGEFRPPLALLGEAPWLHLTTGPPGDLLALHREARRRGLRVAFDPAQEIHYRWTSSNLVRALEGSEILFGNAAEVDRVRTLLGLAKPAELLAFVPLVVITLGSRGAVAYARTGEIKVPAERPSRHPHVTGAGDAFRGGFYAGWFAGEPLAGCLRAGVRSARRWIETGGPSAPRTRAHRSSS